jgi:polyisoprenoid-binding protein YceI
MALGLSAQSNYKVDGAHSSVNFKLKHKGITFVNGKFEKFDGEIFGNLSNPSEMRISFNVETASVNTSVPMRDNHLRSADFFEVEKYPSMSFESTRVEKIDDEHYKLHGKLQIKDVTKETTFDVIYGGSAQGQNGSETIGFIAKNTINRFDYNVAYDPNAGTLSKDVEITLFLEFRSATNN